MSAALASGKRTTDTFCMSTDMKSSVVHLPSKTFDALRDLATAMDREPDELAGEAIETFLAVQAWQRDHIMQGLREAEAGDFATDEEIAAAFASRN